MGDTITGSSTGIAGVLLKREAAVVCAPPCKHQDHCDLWSPRCCACSDTRTEMRQTVGACGVRDYPSLVAGYCASCRSRLLGKHEAVVAARTRAFDRWRQNPACDHERSVMFVNFVLRCRMPFELAQMVLSFLLEVAPCAFFSTFDRPSRPLPTVAEIMRSRAYVHSYRRATPAASGKTGCKHTYCQLSVRQSAGCCACLDKRVYRDFDVIYQDGVGDCVVRIPFWNHYCTGCREAHSGVATGCLF